MIYVASSWRNDYQPGVVAGLRSFGLEVYDFRYPKPGDEGFSWADIAADWRGWTTAEYRKALENPIARDGFQTDLDALLRASKIVLVLPCGRSAHLEAGFACGQGKLVAAYCVERIEPELMYAMFSLITSDWDELVRWAQW